MKSFKGKQAIVLGAGAGMILGWIFGNAGFGLVLGAAFGLVLESLFNKDI